MNRLLATNHIWSGTKAEGGEKSPRHKTWLCCVAI